MQKTPKLNGTYPFFDDGKMSPSRFYLAKVTKILTVKESKKIFFNVTDEYDNTCQKSLYDIWKNEVEEHRNSDGFRVHNKGSKGVVGEPWLYSEDTDYFIECSIPSYDENPIYFVRTVWGGWFSLNTVNWWMSGELDVELEKFNQYEEMFPEAYYENVNFFKNND